MLSRQHDVHRVLAAAGPVCSGRVRQREGGLSEGQRLGGAGQRMGLPRGESPPPPPTNRSVPCCRDGPLQCKVEQCDRCSTFDGACTLCAFGHGLVEEACLPCEQEK